MNVFIVEDSLKTRKELANLLADERGFAVVGEAGSVREALAGIEATLPEAVLLDISLPDGSGVKRVAARMTNSGTKCAIHDESYACHRLDIDQD